MKSLEQLGNELESTLKIKANKQVILGLYRDDLISYWRQGLISLKERFRLEVGATIDYAKLIKWFVYESNSLKVHVLSRDEVYQHLLNGWMTYDEILELDYEEQMALMKECE